MLDLVNVPVCHMTSYQVLLIAVGYIYRGRAAVEHKVREAEADKQGLSVLAGDLNI